MATIPDERIKLVIQSTIEFLMDKFPVEFWSWFDNFVSDMGYIYEDDASDYLIDARKPVH